MNEEENPYLKAALLEVVENQMRDNDPPETRETFDRLISQGISKQDAKIYICQALCVEIWDMMQNRKEFDRERFVRNLKNLPDQPTD